MAPNMELRRAKEAAPTEKGFYYGVPVDMPGRNPSVLRVVLTSEGKLFVQMLRDVLYDLEGFNWYGPVPTCIESGH